MVRGFAITLAIPDHRAGLSYSMADENLRPERESGNKRSHERADVAGETEIVLLKSRMAANEAAVDRIGANVQKLLDRPTNPGFTQVISTFLGTLACCAFIFGFAQFWLFQATAPILTELAAMKQKADWANDSVHAANIKAAVNEERMNWVRDLAKGKSP